MHIFTEYCLFFFNSSIYIKIIKYIILPSFRQNKSKCLGIIVSSNTGLGISYIGMCLEYRPIVYTQLICPKIYKSNT